MVIHRASATKIPLHLLEVYIAGGTSQQIGWQIGSTRSGVPDEVRYDPIYLTEERRNSRKTLIEAKYVRNRVNYLEGPTHL
jgi:hypothetical protein